MDPRRVLGVAVVLIAIALLLLLLWQDGEPSPSRTVQVGGTPDVRVDRAEGGHERGTTSQRELVEPAAAAAEVHLEHQFAYELSCRVLDRDGLPVVGAGIAFAPRDGTPNRWPETTASDGTVRLTWRGRVQTMTMVVGLVHGGQGTALREVEVRSGAPRQVALLVELGGGGDVCAAALSSRTSDCRTCHMGAVMPQLFKPGLRYRQGLHPASHFADLLVADPPENRDLPPGPWEFDAVESAVSVSEEATSGPAAHRAANLPPPPGSIRGRVLDVDGKPIGGATVIWGRDRDRPAGRTTTRRDGSFLFEDVAAGDYEVRAGGGSHGLGRHTVEVFAGQATRCEVGLELGDVIAGRVALPEGHSAEGWRVEYRADDESWIDGTAVTPDGTFRLANLPPGAGTLLLWGDAKTPLPVAVEPAVVVGSSDRVFDLRVVGMPGGAIRVRPSAGGAAEIAGEPEFEVWVWQVASGRGAAAGREGDGAFTLGGLSPGFYRVAVHGAGYGWRSAGEHWIDGRSEGDLGTLPLGEPGLVRIVGLADDTPFELCMRRPELDLRGALQVSDRARLVLPPGQWLALWGSAENLRTREFTVGGSGESLLDLAVTRR